MIIPTIPYGIGAPIDGDLTSEGYCPLADIRWSGEDLIVTIEVQDLSPKYMCSESAIQKEFGTKRPIMIKYEPYNSDQDYSGMAFGESNLAYMLKEEELEEWRADEPIDPRFPIIASCPLSQTISMIREPGDMTVYIPVQNLYPNFMCIEYKLAEYFGTARLITLEYVAAPIGQDLPEISFVETDPAYMVDEKIKDTYYFDIYTKIKYCMGEGFNDLNEEVCKAVHKDREDRAANSSRNLETVKDHKVLSKESNDEGSLNGTTNLGIIDELSLHENSEQEQITQMDEGLDDDADEFLVNSCDGFIESIVCFFEQLSQSPKK